MKNSEEDRKLEDPQGWNDAGYVPSNHRLNNKANNIGGISRVYMRTKTNMGGRVPREAAGNSTILNHTMDDFMRTKQFSGIAMGIGGLAVSRLGADITLVAKAVDLNAK